MDRMPIFNMGDFKKWVEQQQESEFKFSRHEVRVEPKINAKKLAHKIIPEEGERRDLVLDFKENGGLVTDINGKEFLIEVDSGKFFISRQYVKRA
jgi:hypothetical protein